jgi:hypothetical protein
MFADINMSRYHRWGNADLMNATILCEEYNLQGSSLCHFIYAPANVQDNTYEFKVAINESSLKFGLVLVMVPCLEGFCCWGMVEWAPSPCTWDLVQLSLQMILKSLPLLWWQLRWLLGCRGFVLGMHRISVVLWWWHVGIWRCVGMGIGVYISTWESLGGGHLRLAITLNKTEKSCMMCGSHSDHHKVLSPGT